MKPYALFGVAGLLALLLGGALLWQGARQDAGPARPAGGDFVLNSAEGAVDTLALRGQVLLVYFGYTHCPDICPASLAAGGQALNALTPDERARVRLLMVSVDPERDSVEHLKRYTAFFHPAMSGVTGTPAQIAKVARAYGAGYLKGPVQADGSYAIDHTTAIYVVDRDGKLAAVLDLGTPTAQIVSTVRKYL